jgi:hypothetical protein
MNRITKTGLAIMWSLILFVLIAINGFADWGIYVLPNTYN